MATLTAEPILDSPEYRAFLQYVELANEKKQLHARLTEIEQQLKALVPQLLAYLGESGYELVRIQGFTISTMRLPWVRPADGVTTATICAALKQCGWERFVKEGYNGRGLTNYIRELEEHYNLLEEGDGDPNAVRQILPPVLAPLVEIKPSFTLTVRSRKR